jgi:undecaprenyl-diphosphatase
VITNTLFLRLDARDRALLTRWAIGHTASRRIRLFWRLVTHLGGAVCAIGAVAVPLLVGGVSQAAATDAGATLVLSHLLVQLVKRAVSRPRPSVGEAHAALLKAPDRFSFPSGHSAAAMSIAFAYAVAYPPLAAPLVGVAMVVGLSRVVLGVHYPGDVLVGQLMAVLIGATVVTR